MSGTQPALSRESALTLHRPVRSSIQAVLRKAVGFCRKADFERAAQHLDLWDQSHLEDSTILDMISDIALFEPNQRGRRVYDIFLKKRDERLEAGDWQIAQRMQKAWFSIFRVAGWHELAGVWLEDLLTPDRRIWLLDESLEASAPENLAIALRVFDAGAFHAGFGIVAIPDPEAVQLCVSAVASGAPLPVRHSLAAALYGGEIVRVGLLPDGDAMKS